MEAPVVRRLVVWLDVPPHPKQGRRTVNRGGRTWGYSPVADVAADVGMRQAWAAALPADWVPLTGPVTIDAIAYLRAPKSIPRKEWGLKRHVSRPDLKNLQFGLEDAMLGLVVRDDSQFDDCRYRKLYAWDNRVGWSVTLRWPDV